MSETGTTVDTIIEQVENLSLKVRSIEASPFGVTIADMSQEEQPLIYVNDGFTRITGYTEEEILGRNCRFLQGEQTESEPVARMREAIEAGDSVQVELRNYRKNGDLFWSEVTLSPIRNREGKITHYVGFQQDVTRRKESERELESQRDDLSLLNEMVRHDIRNDLQVALASMEVLQAQENLDDRNDQVTSAIDSIYEAIELTNKAREIADIMLDAGRKHYPIEIKQVIESEMADAQSNYPHADICLAGTIPDVSVRANDLLGSVFRNLLANAVKHNDLDSPRVRLSVVEDGETVAVTVADNGSGIGDEERQHIFERGWKDSQSTGTGIGLYVVKRIVDNYDGQITLGDDSLSDPVVPADGVDDDLPADGVDDDLPADGVDDDLPADGVDDDLPEDTVTGLGGATFVVRLPMIP